MPSYESTSGIVLNKRPLRDTDLIVTILTKQFGKIVAVSRGARASKRRFMGGIDVFDYGQFEFSTPLRSSNLYALHSVSGRTSWLSFRSDLMKYALAAFCIELIDKFSPEADEEAGLLLDLLVETLTDIDNAESNLISTAPCAICFALCIQDYAGFDPITGVISLPSDVKSWWQQLRQNKHSTTPKESNHINQSLYILLNYTESILGSQLRTRATLISQLERSR